MRVSIREALNECKHLASLFTRGDYSVEELSPDELKHVKFAPHVFPEHEKLIKPEDVEALKLAVGFHKATWLRPFSGTVPRGGDFGVKRLKWCHFGANEVTVVCFGFWASDTSELPDGVKFVTPLSLPKIDLDFLMSTVLFDYPMPVARLPSTLLLPGESVFGVKLTPEGEYPNVHPLGFALVNYERWEEL